MIASSHRRAVLPWMWVLTHRWQWAYIFNWMKIFSRNEKPRLPLGLKVLIKYLHFSIRWYWCSFWMYTSMLFVCTCTCASVLNNFFPKSYAESIDLSDCNVKNVQACVLATFGTSTIWCNMRESFLIRLGWVLVWERGRSKDNRGVVIDSEGIMGCVKEKKGFRDDFQDGY